MGKKRQRQVTGASGVAPKLNRQGRLVEFLRRYPKMWSWIGGFVSGVAASLLATIAYSNYETAHTASAVACDLLKELQINAKMLERKKSLAGRIYTDYRYGGSELGLRQLDELSLEKFMTVVYRSRAGGLHTLNSDARDSTFGVYGILEHINLNEPKLIDLIRGEKEKREFHLRALSLAYPLAEMGLEKADKSLRPLCR